MSLPHGSEKLGGDAVILDVRQLEGIGVRRDRMVEEPAMLGHILGVLPRVRRRRREGSTLGCSRF